MDVLSVARALLVSSAWIACAATIVHYNKQLMGPGRFPHAMALSCLHMATTVTLTGTLYLIAPSWFPAMATTKGKRMNLLKWFLPMGFFFAAGLFLGTKAYLYASPSFLQFMKQGTLVLVYLMMCSVGRQEFSRSKVAVILWIVGGSYCSVAGELYFSWIGFFVQLSALVCEASRGVLSDWVLNAGAYKLDPLTHTLFISPICLLILIVGAAASWHHSIVTDFARMWPLIIPNALLAFMTNIASSCLIKECSAIGTVLAGRVADLFIVTISVAVFSFPVVPKQFVGFAIGVSGVFFWSYVKICPESWLVRMWEKAFCSHRETEPQALLSDPPENTDAKPVKN